MKARTLELSAHAIDRFCQRVQGMTEAEARALLQERLPSARLLRERTIHGQLRYALDDPPCVLVVRPAREHRRGLVVTVLGPNEVEGPGQASAVEEPPAEEPPRETALGPALWLLKYRLEQPAPQMPPQDLAPALERLAVAVDRRPALSQGRAAPLLMGFTLLAAAETAPRRRRKLELMRDGLRDIIGEGGAGDDEVLRLWSAVVRLAWEEAEQAPPAERGAWEATARVWAEGLKTLRRS